MAIGYGARLNLVLLAGIKLKTAMSNFAAWPQRDPAASGPYDLSIRKAEHTIDNVVDVFKFDAGTVRSMESFKLCCDTSSGGTGAEYGTGAQTAATHMSGLLLDVRHWRWADGFSLESIVGDDFGEGPNGFYRMMCGIMCDLPKTSAHIYCDAA